jgi:hypothetical protein
MLGPQGQQGLLALFLQTRLLKWSQPQVSLVLRCVVQEPQLALSLAMVRKVMLVMQLVRVTACRPQRQVMVMGRHGWCLMSYHLVAVGPHLTSPCQPGPFWLSHLPSHRTQPLTIILRGRSRQHLRCNQDWRSALRGLQGLRISLVLLLPGVTSTLWASHTVCTQQHLLWLLWLSKPQLHHLEEAMVMQRMQHLLHLATARYPRQPMPAFLRA